MAMKFYNTMSRKKEAFAPLRDRMVRMWNCGPTVYDYAHIGNFRAYIFADLLRRYLLFKGYRLRHVMNITDVDDKTIKGSIRNGVSLKEFTKRYEKAFFEDLESLRIQRADIYPRATEHVNEMVSLIKALMKRGIAYKANDGIYYDIRKFKDYGKLARLDMKGLKAGARVKHDSYDKGNAHDFALWKFWDEEDGEVFWETEIGKGRPGWHTECSAMSGKYLGQPFDIHTGGVDLIFPHHQNEIAQSEGAAGKQFVRYWLHNEHLLVEGRKMSKSLGNFYTLRDVLKKGCSPLAIRYLLLATHYRQKLDFSFKGIESAERSIRRLQDLADSLMEYGDGKASGEFPDRLKEARDAFEEALDDDLDISSALATVFTFAKSVNVLIGKGSLSKAQAGEALGFMKTVNDILDVLSFGKKGGAPEEVKELLEKREAAREAKDWKKADKLRDEIKELGFEIQDAPEGAKVRPVRKA